VGGRAWVDKKGRRHRLSGGGPGESDVASVKAPPHVGVLLGGRLRRPFLFSAFVTTLHVAGFSSVWLPTPLKDVPRRILHDGNIRRGCPHLYVNMLGVATSSSPVRFAEAESWLKWYVTAVAAFTGSWLQVDAATNGHDVAIPR